MRRAERDDHAHQSRNISQSRTAVWNSFGIYLFSNLGIGTFHLDTTALGFRKYSQTNIVLNTDQTLKVDVGLSVGSEGQTVMSEANASQVQSETNELSNLISGRPVSQLATNGRSLTALAALGLGVSNNLPSFLRHECAQIGERP